MKKLSLILLISISIAQVWSGPEYIKDIKECHICGKTIIEYIKDHKLYSGNSGMFLAPSSFWAIPDSSRTVTISINKKIKVCPECYKKYDSYIKYPINKLWNESIKEYISINAEKRELYTKQRYENKIKDLDKKILDLIKKRDEERRSGKE